MSRGRTNLHFFHPTLLIVLGDGHRTTVDGDVMYDWWYLGFRGLGPPSKMARFQFDCTYISGTRS